MRIKTSISRTGEFFSPSNPGEKYFGTLTITDGAEILLEIYSTKPLFTALTAPQIGRVIGLVEQGYVTLEGCTFRSRGLSIGAPAKSEIIATTALVGRFEEEFPEFQEYFFSVDCLDEWLSHPGLTITYGDGHNEGTIAFGKPEPLSFKIHDGTEVGIDFNVSTPTKQSYPDTKIVQQAFLSLRPKEPQRLDFYLALSHKITRLMCFLTGYSVNIHSVVGEANVPGLLRYERLVDIYYKSLHLHPSRRLRSDEMLLPYRPIAERFETLLANWVDGYDVLTPALHHFFAVQEESHKYQDTRFLAIAQGLETFHRRTSPDQTMQNASDYAAMLDGIMNSCPSQHADWLQSKLTYANELTLSRRLKQLIAPFHSLFGGRRSSVYIVRKTVLTRNYFTHFDPSLKEDALTGAKLVFVIYKLRVLFILNMLLYLGFTVDEITNLCEEPYLKRMRAVGTL